MPNVLLAMTRGDKRTILNLIAYTQECMNIEMNIDMNIEKSGAVRLNIARMCRQYMNYSL